MPGGSAFYICTTSGGQVVEKTAAGLQDKFLSDSNAQHWTLEYGDSENTVAFQNVSNGQYLFATSGAAYAKIDTSTTKQWWTLSEGRAPGSCWIKCNDYPDAYLCNANGSYENFNKVYVWPKQMNWTHALNWYLKDANAPGFKPKAGNVSGDGAGEPEDLRQREEALMKREQDLAAEEAAQRKHSDQLTDKERELKELAEQQQNALKSNDDASAEAQKLADQQAEMQSQLDEFRQKERDLSARKAAADEQEGQLAELRKKAIEVEQRQSDQLKAENLTLKNQLQDLQRQLATSPPCTHGNIPDPKESSKLRDENARLKDLIAELALQLNDQWKQQRPRKLATGKVSGAASVNGSPPQAVNRPVRSVSTVPGSDTDTSSAPKPTGGSKTISALPNRSSDGANISRPMRQASSTNESTTKQNGISQAAAQKPGTRIANGPANDGGKKPPSAVPSKINIKKQPEVVKVSPGSIKGASTKGAEPKVESVDEDIITYDCGHVLHAPPRKIERRVVGILYEY